MKHSLILATGIGRSEKSFVPEKLAKRLGKPYKIFDWQKHVESIPDPLRKKHLTYGDTESKILKSLMYDYLFDETAYDIMKEKILEDLHHMIKSHGDSDLSLICHSCSCVIFYDYLVEYRPNNIINFITMGNPLPFNKGDNYDGFFPSKWVNFYEESDPVAHKMFREGVEDIDFNSRNVLTGWNPI
jgi:hypothetical protein